MPLSEIKHKHCENKDEESHCICGDVCLLNLNRKEEKVKIGNVLHELELALHLIIKRLLLRLMFH